MSRSKHQTTRSVLGGKTVREIQMMIAENDPELQELVAKRQLKRSFREQRAEDEFADKLQTNAETVHLILEETIESK